MVSCSTTELFLRSLQQESYQIDGKWVIQTSFQVVVFSDLAYKEIALLKYRTLILFAQVKINIVSRCFDCSEYDSKVTKAFDVATLSMIGRDSQSPIVVKLLHCMISFLLRYMLQLLVRRLKLPSPECLCHALVKC